MRHFQRVQRSNDPGGSPLQRLRSGEAVIVTRGCFPSRRWFTTLDKIYEERNHASAIPCVSGSWESGDPECCDALDVFEGRWKNQRGKTVCGKRGRDGCGIISLFHISRSDEFLKQIRSTPRERMKNREVLKPWEAHVNCLEMRKQDFEGLVGDDQPTKRMDSGSRKRN